MGAVAVDVDAFQLLHVTVATDVVAAVDDQAALACIGGQPGEGGAEQAAADDQIVVGW